MEVDARDSEGDVFGVERQDESGDGARVSPRRADLHDAPETDESGDDDDEDEPEGGDE